jgi:hypothetical protein
MDPVVGEVHCLQSLVELESLKEKKKEVKRLVNLYFQFPEPSPEDPLWETES